MYFVILKTEFRLEPLKQKLRSGSTSAQSDQSRHCLHEAPRLSLVGTLMAPLTLNRPTGLPTNSVVGELHLYHADGMLTVKRLVNWKAKDQVESKRHYNTSS